MGLEPLYWDTARNPMFKTECRRAITTDSSLSRLQTLTKDPRTGINTFIGLVGRDTIDAFER